VKTTLLLRAHEPEVGSPEPDIGRAAEHIRWILSRTLARGMEDVGGYVLKTFYEDDPARYRSASAPGHLSLRALIERCGTIDLPMSATFLSTSIRMAVIARRLPQGASFTKLPVSHRVELLRLPESDIERVAITALRDRLPVRALRTTVAKLLVAKPPGRGRPPTPRLVQLSRALQRVVELPPTAEITAEIAALTPVQLRELRGSLRNTAELLSRLATMLND
jgi:hypothetical protein